MTIGTFLAIILFGVPLLIIAAIIIKGFFDNNSMNDTEHSQKSNSLADFFSFKILITPLLVKIIFVLMIVIGFIHGITVIILGINAIKLNGPGGIIIIIGIAIIVLTPVVARLLCELFIVVFSIHNSLKDIKDTNEVQREKIIALLEKQNK